MKGLFFEISLVVVALLLVLSLFFPNVLWGFIVVAPLFGFGLYDIFQKKHAIRRNFPIIGHIRYVLELIRPEIQQYFIEPDWDGRPITRMQRKLIYARSKGDLETIPYGSQKNMYEIGYEWLVHSLHPKEPNTHHPRITIGNEQCKKPYSASTLNISGMSYGALSKNAILALSRGAKEGDFFLNTGEGGISPYHLENKSDLVMQIGTAYFGCRTKAGKFCPNRFKILANNPLVKMVEIKISQGAKPGGGGILPTEKITKEIAEIRGIDIGKELVSPAHHSAFSTPTELMEFVHQLRDLSNGKPIGIKLAIGSKEDFENICKAMISSKTFLDFITIDGGEGGTGAAPISFINAVGTPLNEALAFSDDTLKKYNLRDKIKIIAAGKLITEFEMVSKLALGADLINSCRGMMLALGCIQSLRCNSNHCPTGVTSHKRDLMYGLVINEKYKRVARYQN